MKQHKTEKKARWLPLRAFLVPLAFLVAFQHQVLLSPAVHQGVDNGGEQSDFSREAVSRPRESSEFAYAFVVGGCDPDTPKYRGFLYNILVSTRILKNFGSRADVVAFFQMAYGSDHDKLPENETRLLEALGVIVQYIPPSQYESFYEITLNKFIILDMIQYKRVLFLDADVMPLGNLDYLFEISSGKNNNNLPTFKEDIVLAGKQEPCTAGFFLLSPGKGELDRLHEVIRKREERAKDLPFPKFDIVEGWGTVIKSPDKWETLSQSGTNWTFYSGDADQGLLYQWTKYVKQSVSIILGRKVQNWSPGKSGYPQLEAVLEDPLQNVSWRISPWAKGAAPYRHFHHFTGSSKPWEGMMPEKLSDANHKKSPYRFWFFHLLQLNKEFQFFSDDDWEQVRAQIGRPPLGRFHGKEDMARRVDRTNARTEHASY